MIADLLLERLVGRRRIRAQQLERRGEGRAIACDDLVCVVQTPDVRGETVVVLALEQHRRAVEHLGDAAFVDAAARLLAFVALDQLLDARIAACSTREQTDRNERDRCSHATIVTRSALQTGSRRTQPTARNPPKHAAPRAKELQKGTRLTAR
jgi:hypothetical protein